MDQEELKQIFTALESINHSLDERFERDTNLYISVEKIDELKRQIYLGHYGQIVDRFTYKIFSAEALTNVVVKNAWLIQRPQFEKYEALEPIFEACDFRYFSAVMQDGVFENKIEMPSVFRIFLLSIFLNRADAATCTQMLEQDIQFLNNVKLRAICVQRVLAELPVLERYTRFNEYIQRWENLLTEDKELKKLFPSDELNDAVKDKIFENEIVGDTTASDFWIDCLDAKGAEYIFIQFENYCRANSGSSSKIKPWLLNMFKLARKTGVFTSFAGHFARACDFMDAQNKTSLAQNGINKSTDTETTVLKSTLESHGIETGERGELADKEKIIELLNSPWYARSLSYLVKSFKQNYAKTYEQTLDEIGDEVDAERFEKFCFRLIELTDNSAWVNIKYLLYFIEKIIPPAANGNNPSVRQLLNYIERKAVLTSHDFKKQPGFETVSKFVREKDFALFARLTA